MDLDAWTVKEDSSVCRGIHLVLGNILLFDCLIFFFRRIVVVIIFFWAIFPSGSMSSLISL